MEDSVYSDLLLHVVDASDAYLAEKIEIVDDILAKIGADQKKIYVFNKIDLISKEQQMALKKEWKHLKPVFISAEKGVGLEMLKEGIDKALS